VGAVTTQTDRGRAAELAAHTPADRNRYFDFMGAGPDGGPVVAPLRVQQGRARRSDTAVGRPAPWVVVLGAIATSAGLVGLVAQGFLPGSGPGGIAVIPLALLGAGAMLLLPRASRRA